MPSRGWMLARPWLFTVLAVLTIARSAAGSAEAFDCGFYKFVVAREGRAVVASVMLSDKPLLVYRNAYVCVACPVERRLRSLTELALRGRLEDITLAKEVGDFMCSRGFKVDLWVKGGVILVRLVNFEFSSVEQAADIAGELAHRFADRGLHALIYDESIRRWFRELDELSLDVRAHAIWSLRDEEFREEFTKFVKGLGMEVVDVCKWIEGKYVCTRMPLVKVGFGTWRDPLLGKTYYYISVSTPKTLNEVREEVMVTARKAVDFFREYVPEDLKLLVLVREEVFGVKLALHIPRFYLILERIVVPAAIIGFAVTGLLFCAYLELREKLQRRRRCVSDPLPASNR